MFERRSLCRRGLAVLATLVLLPLRTEAAMPDPLQRYIGTSRVLLVFAPGSDDAFLVEQRLVLASMAQGLSQRDLVVVEVVGSVVTGPAMPAGVSADALRRRFGVAASAFRAVLVGKDGGAKLSEAAPIGADRLFAVVDAMPMRRQEMGR